MKDHQKLSLYYIINQKPYNNSFQNKSTKCGFKHWLPGSHPGYDQKFNDTGRKSPKSVVVMYYKKQKPYRNSNLKAKYGV